MNKTVTWRTMHNMHAPKIKIRDYFSRYFTQGCWNSAFQEDFRRSAQSWTKESFIWSIFLFFVKQVDELKFVESVWKTKTQSTDSNTTYFTAQWIWLNKNFFKTHSNAFPFHNKYTVLEPCNTWDSLCSGLLRWQRQHRELFSIQHIPGKVIDGSG